jgi:transposase
MKAYSLDLRDRVIATYKEGKLNKMEISITFKVGYDTVLDWIQRFITTGDYSSKQGVGCGRAMRFNDKDAIMTFIEENPDANGIDIRDNVAPELPMSTFYDTLSRLQITYKKKSLNISNEMKK